MRSMETVVRSLPEPPRFVLATQRRPLSHARPNGAELRSPLQMLASGQIDLPRPIRVGFAVAAIRLVAHTVGIRRRCDVIHANGLTEAMLVVPLAFVSRLPVVVWVHNYASPRAFPSVYRLMGRQMRGWRWLAVSETARRLLPPDLKVELLPNPIAIGRVAPPTASETCVVTYLAGTDHPVKGFDLLPRIIEATKNPSVRFRVYANRSVSTRHERSNEAWDWFSRAVDDRVELHPFVSDVGPVLASSDVVLVPSRAESFNRVMAESMAAGRPVVASYIGAHAAHCAGGPVGLFFDIDDPVCAGRQIDQLATNLRLRHELGDHGAACARAYDPTLIACRLARAWSDHQ